jgi:hypothetical protein
LELDDFERDLSRPVAWDNFSLHEAIKDLPGASVEIVLVEQVS